MVEPGIAFWMIRHFVPSWKQRWHWMSRSTCIQPSHPEPSRTPTIAIDPAISGALATAGWGWHLETGIHALRMILAGIFDQYPSLQLILGHWGEMIPFYLARVDEVLTPASK